MPVPQVAPPDRPDVSVIEVQIVALAERWLADPAPSAAGRGRPQLLPAVVLWTALILGVLKRDMTQVGIWRTITQRIWWDRGLIHLSKEAVYHRLNAADCAEMADFFQNMTSLLLAERAAAPGYASLAPFATGVYALDESTLPKLAKRLPELKARAKHDPALLAGKVTVTLDLRRQLFHSVQIQEKGNQNERVAARSAVATLPIGSLVIFDLGYFGFEWFDDLHDAGYCYISRLRSDISYETHLVLGEHGATRDTLIWLGAHRSDRAKHLVRLIEFTVDGTRRRYITNVRDPHDLSIRQLVDLYALRWSIERAFNLVKTDLQLAVLWSAKQSVCHLQIWGVFLIAQLIMSARAAVAERADCPLAWVSTPLLVKYLPDYARQYADPIGMFAQVGRVQGFIRKPRTITLIVPDIPPDADGPSPTTYPTRTARHARKQ